MQWTTPRDRWIEEVYQIYLCWEHHYQFSKSPKSQVSGEVIDSFLLEYASLTASRTVLQWLLGYLNFTLDSKKIFCGCKRKTLFLWVTAAAQAAENHGDEWGLTWYLQSRIWTHLQCTSSRRSTNLKISSHGKSLRLSRRTSQTAWE